MLSFHFMFLLLSWLFPI